MPYGQDDTATGYGLDAPASVEETYANIARSEYQKSSPGMQAALQDSISPPSLNSSPLMRQTAQNVFSQRVTDEFDKQQEAQYLQYQAANSDVSPAHLSKARQLWIAKPELDLDYIVKNLNSVEKEVQADNIPWDLVARQHPVLARYLKDPSTIAQTLQDTSSLTGLARALGGNVQALQPDGTLKTKYQLPAWMIQAKDALINNTREMFTSFGYSIFNADSQLAVYLRKKGVPDFLLNDKETLEDTKRRWLDATEKLHAESTSAKDYYGYMDWDTASFAQKVGRTAEVGVGGVMKNVDLLAGMALSKTIGGSKMLFNFNRTYATMDLYPKAQVASDDPIKSAILTAAAAPMLGKLMEWSPAGTAVGARVGSIIENGVGRAAAEAFASRSYAQLLRTFVVKGGWDFAAGQVALGTQAAANAGVLQLASAWGGKGTDPSAIARAFHEGFTNPEFALMSLFGTGRNIIEGVGKMHRAQAMASAMEDVRENILDSKTAQNDPKLHEQQVKEIASQPGLDANILLPLGRFNEVLEKQGFDPRAVAAVLHEDGGKSYDKAVAEGAEHLQIPIEKSRKLFESKQLGDFAMNEGKLDPNTLSRLEANKVSEEFQKALESAIKVKPEELSGDDKAVYDAINRFAGTDKSVASELYAQIKALHKLNPDTNIQDLFNATWGRGGLYGPEAGNPAEEMLKKVEREYALYDLSDEAAHQVAKDRLAMALQAGIRNQIKYERADLQKQALKEIQKDPAQRARHFFETGELWGDSTRKMMLTDPKTGRQLPLSAKDVQALGFDPKNFPKGVVAEKGPTVDVDAAANALGYEGSTFTGDNVADRMPARRMLIGLQNSLSEKEFSNQWADLKLKETHSALLDNPQELLRAALDAVHNPREASSIVSRMRSLQKDLDPMRQARSGFSTEEWQDYANQIIQSKSLGQLKPETFARAGKAAIERSIEATNPGKQYDALEAALLNHHLYRAAREMQGSIGAMYSKLTDYYGSDSLRANLGKADPAYRDFRDALLGAVGIGEPDPNAQQRLADYMQKVQENGQAENSAADRVGGWDSQLVGSVLTGDRAWKELNPDEAKQIYNAITNIQHVAKLQNKNLKAIRDANRDSLIASAKNYLSRGGTLPTKPIPQDRTLSPDKRPNLLTEMWKDAYNDSPRSILEKLGPEIKAKIDGGFVDSRVNERDLLHKLYEPWKATQKIWENDPEFHKALPGLEDQLRIPGLDGPLSKKYLVQLVKWMGTDSGRKKALDGLGVNADEVFKAAGQYLGPHELDAIQQEHKFFDEVLRPLKAEAWERRTGLKWETPTPQDYEIKFTSDGTTRHYDGGYYPIHWDGRPGVEKLARPVSMEGDGIIYPKVPDGSFQKRTKYTGVPDFSWNNVPAHLLADIHNLAFGDFVQDANRVLLHPEMLRTMRQYLGEDYAAWPRNWLQRVATESGGSVSGHLSDVGTAARLARSGFITGAVGLNLPIFAAHMPHVLAVATMRDGIAMSMGYAAPSVGRILESYTTSLATGTNPIREDALSKSRVLQLRGDELREQMGRWFKGTYDVQSDSWAGKLDRAQDRAQAVGFWHLREMDAMASTMIWDAKYRYGLDQHGNEQKAIEDADEQVRAAMPNYNVMETPSVLAEKRSAVVSSLLVFHSFWAKYREMVNDAKYNMVEMPFKEAMAGQRGYADAAWQTAKFAGKVSAALTFGVVAGEFLKGQGKQDDENWTTWFLKREASAPLKLFPYASDLFGGGIEHLAGEMSEDKFEKLQNVDINNPYFAPFVRSVNAIQHAMDPRKSNDDKAFELATAALMLAGMPAYSPAKAARYGYSLMTGEERPRGGFDTASGFIYGRKYGRAARFNTATPLTLMQDFAEEGSK